MRWKIFYADESTYSHLDGSPFDAPSVGVEVVKLEERTMHGKDAYYWKDELAWVGCDIPGLWDYLMFHRGPKAVLFGRTIRDDLFWSIVAQATKDTL